MKIVGDRSGCTGEKRRHPTPTWHLARALVALLLLALGCNSTRYQEQCSSTLIIEPLADGGAKYTSYDDERNEVFECSKLPPGIRLPKQALPAK